MDGAALQVDVALPVYNGEQHIAATIESLINQSHKSLRVLVSDNGSTDATPDIVRTFADQDDRVILDLSDRNRGAIWNFNHAMASTRAPYVMWASAHDIYDPRYVESCLSVMVAKPEVVLCYSGAHWIDQNGVHISPLTAVMDTQGLTRHARLNVVLWGFGPYNYAVYGLMRRDALTCLRKWPRPYPDRVAPDHLLLGELSLLGEFAYIAEPLFSLRRMADQGDFDAYADKLRVRPRTRLQAVLTMGRFVSSMAALTRGHDMPFTHRITCIANGAAAGVSNYRGIASNLWAQGGGRAFASLRARGSERRVPVEHPKDVATSRTALLRP